MLADQLDYVVGVDPHRDSHALAVVEVVSGAVVFEATVAANSDGYAEALQLAEQHAPGRRAFAVEGTGSFGAGSDPLPDGRGERVLEVGRLRRERRSGGKTDALDADPCRPQRARPGAAGDAAGRRGTPGAAGACRRTRRSSQREAGRALPAARPADHHARAAAQRAAAADPCTAPATRSQQPDPSGDTTPSCAAACSRCARSPDACCS